jgi:hypothetical protein
MALARFEAWQFDAVAPIQLDLGRATFVTSSLVF